MMSVMLRHALTRCTKNRKLLIRLSLCMVVVLAVIYFCAHPHALLNLPKHLMLRNVLRTKIHAAHSNAISPPLPPLSKKQIEQFTKLNPVIEGWGEDGEPVYLDSADQAQAEQIFSSAAFNVFISDRISPNRSLPDPRPDECASVPYKIDSIGQASVVIIYTNEIWSALVRTIWSVVNRSPRVLLKEIILVDDFSDKSELKAPLDQYVAHYFGNLVRIIRLEQRQGLIRARLIGANASQGDVIIFLDSHCEATEGWLEPLMQTVKENRRNVVCPVIDIISDKNLEYVAGNKYYFQVGGFIWSGHFVWLDINEDDLRQNPTRPVKSPTMAGGLFAISREYFFEIGSYDEQMEIWGGENLELSFRLWQCGGQLYIHPCSHVGHIFRDYHPYSFLGKDSHGYNTLRTVLVWMDEYSRYFFLHRKDLQNRSSGVDVSARVRLRERLQCKSFEWYLSNVYTEKKYMYDRDVYAYGSVRNPISGLCLDNLNRPEDSKHDLGVYTCIDAPLTEWTNQMFSWMISGEIRREESCLSIEEMANHKVVMSKCINLDNLPHSMKRRARLKKRLQTWTHKKGGQIINEQVNLCLSTESLHSSDNLRAVECNSDDLYQLWWFQHYTDLEVKVRPLSSSL